MTEEVKTLLKTLDVYIFGAIGIGIVVLCFELAKKFYLWLGMSFWDYLKRRLFGSSSMNQKIRNNIKFINDLVVEIRNTLKADRCYIFEFHNGEYFSSRESRWKVSQAYESCDEGVSSQGNDFRDVDVSMLWSSFEIFFSHLEDSLPNGISVYKPNAPYCKDKIVCNPPKRMYIFKVSDIENRFHKSILEREGVKYMIHTPILNENDDVIGVIGIDYIDELDFETLQYNFDFSFCNLCRASDQIAYSWMLQRKKTKKVKKIK